MRNDDWFRCRDWDEPARSTFFARLNRSRTERSKAQYCRIQAFTLLEAGQPGGALELAEHAVRHHPVRTELALLHYARARCLVALGQSEDAPTAFRDSLDGQRAFPPLRTQAWLDFARFVVEQPRPSLFTEILAVLAEFEPSSTPLLPVEQYTLFGCRAIIHHHAGEFSKARQLARRALETASVQQSGFARHPTIGLVHDHASSFHTTLQSLAAA